MIISNDYLCDKIINVFLPGIAGTRSYTLPVPGYGGQSRYCKHKLNRKILIRLFYFLKISDLPLTFCECEATGWSCWPSFTTGCLIVVESEELFYKLALIDLQVRAFIFWNISFYKSTKWHHFKSECETGLTYANFPWGRTLKSKTHFLVLVRGNLFISSESF